MAAEWDRLQDVMHDPNSTINMLEFASGALLALNWAYRDRAGRPSTLVRLDPVPRKVAKAASGRDGNL